MNESVSPFLQGTNVQYAWDSTSLGYLKTCPRLYYYTMIEGWRSNSESIHIKFGGWYHSALEEFDRLRFQGYGHDEALEAVVLKTLQDTWSELEGSWFSGHPAKTRENLIRSIIWYCDHFREDSAETVALANGKPAVELSFKMQLDFGPEGRLGGQPYLLCGHIDRLVNFTGGFYVTDRKTTSSTVASNYFDQYDPDNQMSLYTLAAKVIYKTPVRGVIIDAVQIAVGFSRFSRGFTYRTDSQLEEWLKDTRRWFHLAEQFAAEGHWPMNDKSCHQYGGCAFRKVCSKSPEVREKFLESDFHKEPWNPLVPR